MKILLAFFEGLFAKNYLKKLVSEMRRIFFQVQIGYFKIFFGVYAFTSVFIGELYFWNLENNLVKNQANLVLNSWYFKFETWSVNVIHYSTFQRVTAFLLERS